MNRKAGRAIFALMQVILLSAVLSGPSVAGSVEASARYYWVSEVEVDDGGLGVSLCGQITIVDLRADPDFGERRRLVRTSSGVDIVLGRIFYKNFSCISSILDFAVKVTFKVFFYEPVFREIDDPLECFPLMSCIREIDQEVVDFKIGTESWTAKLTPNVGDARADADGILLSAPGISAWVPEGFSASFWAVVSYSSPFTITGLVPADDVGFVTEGDSPLGDYVIPSSSTFSALRAAGIQIDSAPEVRLERIRAWLEGNEPGRSITQKIQQVEAYFAADDYSSACAMLLPISLQVSGLTGSKLDEELATLLQEEIEAIRAALACEP